MAPLKFKVYDELTEVKRKLILCAMYVCKFMAKALHAGISRRAVTYTYKELR